MRDLWVDRGDGSLIIQTETLHISIYSKARKNYHHVRSNWSMCFSVKGKYGYAASFWNTFGGTIEEAMTRAETVATEIFESLKEIM
jgi:hypothetical protein